jgi:hypothetical protein
MSPWRPTLVSPATGCSPTPSLGDLVQTYFERLHSQAAAPPLPDFLSTAIIGDVAGSGTLSGSAAT